MDVNFEALLVGSNKAKNYVESNIAILDQEVLNWKENDKKWSVLEILSHLNQVCELYFPKFEKVLSQAKPLPEGKFLSKQNTILGQLSIYSMLPKNRKRRFKMTTFNFFEPVSSPEFTEKTISKYLENKERLNQFINQARFLDLSRLKISTALGDKVRFYIPECFEFLLAHEERHMIQLEEVLIQQHSA
ncbi:MAG: hypothetical protein ACJA08_001418 [Cyclobacteriaceae bacterium]|jgi:hypothetical protein